MEMNPEQQAAIEHGAGPLLIVAGAGTGKTAVITERIAWLVREKGARTDEILALTFTDKAANEMEERIDRLLPMGYVDLAVSTFHAFGERVLRERGLDIGLPPTFRLLSAAEQWLLVRRNLERFDLDYYKPLGNPTKFIAALVQHFSRAKDEGVMPEEYIRFAKAKGKRSREAGSRLPENQIQRAGKKGKVTSGSKGRSLPASHPELVSGASGEEVEEQKRMLEVANAYATYETLLRENSALDFGDLILQTLILFRTRPVILREYQQRFRYLLVDEFQDTNYAQYELVKLLAKPTGNLTVVGDDDQSIYKFRGAAVSNILEFKKDFPKSREVVLTENYRSRQEILDASYAFIQHNNPNRLEARLTTSALQKKGALLSKPVVKKLHAAREGTGLVAYESFGDADEEARAVVHRLVALKEENPNTPWSEFAVLLRANHQADLFVRALSSAGIPYQFVAKRGLYQRLEVLIPLAVLACIADAHDDNALHRLLDSELFRVPHEDIGLLLREARRRHAPLMTVLATLDEVAGVSEGGKKACALVRELLEELAAFNRTATASRVLQKFFAATKYLDRFDRDREADKILNVAALWKRVKAFEDNAADKRVAAFIDEMRFVSEVGEDPAPPSPQDGPDSVRIMTAHSAKGLEFSYVFLPQLIDLRFPSSERRDAIELPEALVGDIVLPGDAHLEEERRLFYVALTRAKDGVFLSSAEDYGGSRKRKPSRFLFELGLATAAAPTNRAQQTALAFTEPVAEPASRMREHVPEHVSYTQLKAFDTCPKQYYYAHVLELPTIGKPSFSFGKTVHATLKGFYELLQQGKQPTVKELLALYDREWIGEWYASDADEAKRKEAGRKALTHFYATNKGAFDAPLALEKDFHLKVGPYMLRGKIDRIDGMANSESHMANGKKMVNIIDYKTGTTPKTKKLEAYDQLLIYALAATEVLGFEPQSLVYYYVESSTPFVFDAVAGKLEKLKTTVLDLVERITTSDFKATPGQHCRTCDFRDICEDRAV